MITFNPDPKAQAEAMIKQFLPFAKSDVELDGGSTQWIRDKERRNAKACALIAAKMLKDNAESLLSPIDHHPFDYRYWSAVIDELKKI